MNTAGLISTKKELDTSRLHPDIINLLFSHKKHILTGLSDVKGLYFIDHIALILFSPDNEIVIFSMTPSVEYNVIIHNLWRDDIAFNPGMYNDGTMVFWNDAKISENKLLALKKVKELNHNIKSGFNLYKKQDDFKLVYSFATRNGSIEAHDYYSQLKNELFLIGDYGYRLIRDLYSSYCPNHEVPILNSTFSRKPKLQLIVNNDT